MSNFQPKNAGFIDKNIVYPIANKFSCLAYSIGLTPNHITILTFIIRSVAIYYMYLKQKPKMVFYMFVISWFTDALDGIIARKYDMKSEIGAHLDALVDVTTVTTTFIVLLIKYYNNNLYDFAILLGVLGFCYFLMSIKLKADKDHYKSSKPWEKFLSCIPLNLESNILINQIDPGLIYLVVLGGLYHGLFKLK